jgi:hypothetical protein
MRNYKLNLCHGQQISDFVLDLFAIFADFSNLPNESSRGQKVSANKVGVVIGQRPDFLRGAGCEHVVE